MTSEHFSSPCCSSLIRLGGFIHNKRTTQQNVWHNESSDQVKAVPSSSDLSELNLPLERHFNEKIVSPVDKDCGASDPAAETTGRSTENKHSKINKQLELQ